MKYVCMFLSMFFCLGVAGANQDVDIKSNDVVTVVATEKVSVAPKKKTETEKKKVSEKSTSKSKIVAKKKSAAEKKAVTEEVATEETVMEQVETIPEETQSLGYDFDANVNNDYHLASDFRHSGGDGYDDASGYSYTWYSENVLPGGGLDIPGRHVNEDEYICDEDGYICIASDDFEQGTRIRIPFGYGFGKVYDSGSGKGNLDIYTSW